MSCRIIGREVEVTFVNYIALMLKKMGIKKLIGEYIPTKKNELTRDIYSKLDFKKEKEKDGIIIWNLDLTDFKPVSPKYIRIEEKDG